IAHLAMSQRAAATARRRAYEETMAGAGLGAFVQVAPEWDGGVPELVGSVGEPDGPTAVFASNDRGAAAVVAAALDRGLRVPEQLSVVGYDNTALAQALRPALTSVDQPRPEMGRLAMDQLAELMAGGEARHEVVEPELVVRRSTLQVG